MVDKGKVEKMIADLGKGVITLGAKKEVRHLPEILEENEVILYLTSGLMDNKTWLITATNHRVIFLDKGFIYGCDQYEIPISKISSIFHSTGILVGKITIKDGADGTEIRNVHKKTTQPFAVAVNKAIMDFNKPKESASSSDEESTAIKTLNMIESLYQKNAITEGEYKERRKEVIDSL